MSYKLSLLNETNEILPNSKHTWTHREIGGYICEDEESKKVINTTQGFSGEWSCTFRVSLSDST